MHPSYMNSNGSTSFHNHETLNLKTTNMQSINSNVVLENNCLTGKIIRSCKKDRHRKINTARGPKDRRMRLSLDVATKFFRLQDMLGFDKASHTIQWLLMKSKPAIRDLQQLNQSSECEVLQSGIDEKKRVDQREVKKSVYIDHTLAKETREKARARARKRTTEKRNLIKLGSDDQCSKVIRPSGLGPLIPFGEDQVQLTDQADQYPSSHFQFKQGIVGDDSSMMSGNFNPFFLLNHQHNLGPSVIEHQFSDFQILGKPWESINKYI